jgi:hypothetical protein
MLSNGDKIPELELKKGDDGKFIAASVATGIAISPFAAMAQTAPTGDVAGVSTVISSLAGIASAIAVIVLGAMGVRMAIKLVNRVATKG